MSFSRAHVGSSSRLSVSNRRNSIFVWNLDITISGWSWAATAPVSNAGLEFKGKKFKVRIRPPHFCHCVYRVLAYLDSCTHIQSVKTVKLENTENVYRDSRARFLRLREAHVVKDRPLCIYVRAIGLQRCYCTGTSHESEMTWEKRGNAIWRRPNDTDV